MKSANPHSGCREVGTAKTLDCGTPDPNRNQGGIAIIQKGNEYAAAYANGTETVARTLTARADGSPMLDRGPNVVIQKGNEHEKSNCD